MIDPIDSTMNCERFTDALPDLLERDVDETTRSTLEAHALACAECGPLLADLRKLRIDAANLPVLEPSRDLWSGIARRIETPVVELTPAGGTVERWSGGTVERSNGGSGERRWISPRWAGLAAAGIVAVTAAITHQVTKSTIDVRPSAPAQTVAAVRNTTPVLTTVSTPPSADTVRSTDTSAAAVSPLERSTVPPTVSLASNRPSAEAVYDAEIKRLRAIVATRRATLDTATVAVIERNLKIIDEAIAQCRDALRRDPASRFLIESLNDALDTKIQLLRTAAMLPARS